MKDDCEIVHNFPIEISNKKIDFQSTSWFKEIEIAILKQRTEPKEIYSCFCEIIVGKKGASSLSLYSNLFNKKMKLISKIKLL